MLEVLYLCVITKRVFLLLVVDKHFITNEEILTSDNWSATTKPIESKLII